MRRGAVVSTLLTVAALPAQAAGQSPVPAVAPAQPLQSEMTLTVQRVGGTRATALVGARIRVRGAVGVYVPGETMVVRFATPRRRAIVKRVVLLPGATGGAAFVLWHRLSRPGRLIVSAAHEATPALGALSARARGVDVLPRRLGARSGRAAVRALQRRLRRLGYVVGAPGTFGGRTARAVLAFRKVTGMRRTTNASPPVMRALARGRGRFAVRRPEHGRHIEADLSRQVLALIEGGRVERIYPMSSGAASTRTPTGSFRVYLKTPGTNAKGMVHSAYFIGAYATHGFASVPVYPASHGCLRVPMADALSIFRWIAIGTPVDVYR